jgi:hypothetical protein
MSESSIHDPDDSTVKELVQKIMMPLRDHLAAVEGRKSIVEAINAVGISVSFVIGTLPMEGRVEMLAFLRETIQIQIDEIDRSQSSVH